MKILSVVGARPQFIKAAVVSRALRNQTNLREILVHTGQHYDDNMSGQFFEQLEIPKPDYQLNVGSGSHGVQTGQMLGAVEDAMMRERPDYALVYGDTNSTLAGALAAAKLHIPVAHVEAGLRSFNRRMPEEINRIVTDHLSSSLYAPTQTGVDNLAREGIDGQRVHLVGDVMYDAALFYEQKARRLSRILEQLALQPRSFGLATIHRAENTDDKARLTAIVEGLARAAQSLPLILPLHPRTAKALEQAGLDSVAGKSAKTPGLTIIEPLGYLDMIRLEAQAAVVVTDSGGVQKEAYFHRVPCVTLREETEWTELVQSKWNVLCPPVSADAIASAILAARGRLGEEVSLYGAGQASSLIAQSLGSG